jgi:hypothetical protein
MSISRAAFTRIVEDDHDQDQELENMDASWVGVRARVELHIPGPPGSNYTIAHVVTSPGLWGIQHDGTTASDDYLGEVFDEECDTLADMLTALGVKVTS